MTKKNLLSYYLSFVSFILINFSINQSFTQHLTLQNLDTCKKYKSIEQAIKSPELVYILDLSKKKIN